MLLSEFFSKYNMKLIEKNTFIDIEEYMPENKLKRNKSLYNLYTINKTINNDLDTFINNITFNITTKLDISITQEIFKILEFLQNEEGQLYWLLKETKYIIQIIDIIIKIHKNKNNVSNDDKDILKHFFLKLHDTTIKHSPIMIIFIEFMRFEMEPEYVDKVIDGLYTNNKKLTDKERLLNKIEINSNIKIFTKISDSVKLEQNNINNLIEKLKVKKDKISLSLTDKKLEIYNYLKHNKELLSNFITDQWGNIQNGHIVRYTINANVFKINKSYNIQIVIPILHYYIDYMSINFKDI